MFSFGDYELDEERFELRCGGVKVPVQPKVLDVLLCLVRQRDRVVLKRELLEAVWAGVVVSEASLSRVIMEARKAIGDELQQLVVTVRGRGFRFAGRVVEMARAAAAPAPPLHDGGPDPTFIGRAACMASLEARLDDAAAGRGGLVWLSGEAGVGKTRTADELARRARARGFVVLAASAHETAGAPPYWLWAHVARAYAATASEVGLPALPATFAPLLDGDRTLSSEAEFTLFDSFTRHFLAASRVRPLLFVFDDMHWADDGSLRLLQFFAREARAGALLVVGTYRDTAIAGDERARSLARLLREFASLSIPLRGMSIDDIPRFVEVAAGSAPSHAFAKALYERSGGSPLYLHQLLKTEWAERSLTESAVELASSMDLQQGLVESICRHADAVSAEARDLLTAAAVLGREFELAKLSMVSGFGQADLLGRLDEAVNARLLIKSKTGSYRFAHVLVRDVLYKKLSSAERSARHLFIGEKLAAHYGDAIDSHAAELAHHFVRALPNGDPSRAVDLSIRAAQHDVAQGAHKSAAKHWEQAAQALAQVRGDDARRTRVQLGLARARAKSGDAALAREAFLDAAILARTFAEPEALAECALGLAQIEGTDPTQRRAALEEALAALAASSGDGAAKLKASVEAALRA